MEYYGINDPGEEYDVHHIDFNRENNDIRNLILLPKKLHHQYHMCVQCLGGGGGKPIALDAKIGSYGMTSPVVLSSLRRFSDIADEIKKWSDWKERLDFGNWMDSLDDKDA